MSQECSSSHFKSCSCVYQILPEVTRPLCFPTSSLRWLRRKILGRCVLQGCNVKPIHFSKRVLYWFPQPMKLIRSIIFAADIFQAVGHQVPLTELADLSRDPWNTKLYHFGSIVQHMVTLFRIAFNMWVNTFRSNKKMRQR